MATGSSKLVDRPHPEEMERVLGLHPIVRWGLVIFFGATLIFVAWGYCSFVQDPSDQMSPRQLGLPTIFVFSGTALFLLLVPWQKLGLRLKRFAGFEFERIVETQANEHAEELAEIDDRIESLESAVRGVHEGIQLGEIYHEPALREELLEFFKKHHTSAFSPLRIRQWGAKQTGFEQLANYDPAFLRSTLRKLVAEGVLETTISAKGSTLYRLIG